MSKLRLMKRLFDIYCSAFGLLVLLPAFVVLIILIKIESPGPGFYTQQRVGRNSRMFNLFKLRTMHLNADKLTAITVGARDPRITRIGYYPTKHKIDELPQLINVMRGDMSLVG